jgi:hypothetical protein
MMARDRKYGMDYKKNNISTDREKEIILIFIL